MKREKTTIVVVCGPTAVGKTAVGIELAKRFDGEIISADSQQVWRGFDIGTAKASVREMSSVKHHLIDVADPDEHFDVSRYVKLADEKIEDLINRGKKVFVVGGTGLYIKALLYGICSSPPQDQAYRKELDLILKGHGSLTLHEKLAKLDPESAQTIHPNDKTRIIRALEILHLTGKTPSEFYREHGFSKKRYDAIQIGLNCDRDVLYKRIDERVDRMIEGGLVEEVISLLKRWPPESQPFRAVGYSEIISYINGEIDLDRAIYLTKLNSRHFAKRQITWFKAQDDVEWFSTQEPDFLTNLTRWTFDYMCAENLKKE